LPKLNEIEACGIAFRHCPEGVRPGVNAP